MDVLTATKILLRRWYIVITVLALSGTVTAVVVSSVPASYRSSGSLVVASPGSGAATAAAAQNPFSNLDYSASLVANIVSGLMQQKPAREKLVAHGAKPDYTIGTPGGTTTPVIDIEATADTPELAIRTVALVLAATQDQLIATQRDAGAPPGTWVRSYLLSKPVTADRLVAGKVRALVALTALALAAAASTAFIAENIAVRRREDESVTEFAPRGLPRSTTRPEPVIENPRRLRMPKVRASSDRSEVEPDTDAPRTRTEAFRATPATRSPITPVNAEARAASRGTKPVPPGIEAVHERLALPLLNRRHPSASNLPPNERVPSTGTDQEQLKG